MVIKKIHLGAQVEGEQYPTLGERKLGTVWNGKSVFPSQEGKAGHPFRGEGSDRDRKLVRYREIGQLIYV